MATGICDKMIFMVQLQYNPKVLKHFRKPKNVGEIKNPDGEAVVGNPVCVVPNTLILANSRPVQIKDIKGGEKVMGHDGCYHVAKKIYQRNYSGKIYSIRVHNLGELTVTPEHHILALKMSHIAHKFVAFKKKKPLKDWFCASELEKGDVVLYPIPKEIRDKGLLKTEIEKPYWDFRSKDIPEEVVIDDNFLRLVGYYLSEGYLRTKVTQKALGFTFGSHETQFIEDVIFLMKKIFGVSPSDVRASHNSTNIMFYRSQLVYFFEKLFGRGALNKHLPHWMMILPVKKQKALLCGLWRGNGYINEKRKVSKFVTISERLAYQLRLLLLRQKIISSFLVTPEKGMHKKHYSFYVKEDGSLRKLAKIVGIDVDFPVKKKSPHKTWFDENFYYAPIWKIRSFNYRSKPVYNLEVETSASYVSNAATLHNCGDVMKMMIKINKRTKGQKNKRTGEYIKEIKFQTLGCGAAISTSSILTEMVKGKTLDEALKIRNEDVVKELGGLPPIKLHCSLLAVEALRKAIADYRKKK